MQEQELSGVLKGLALAIEFESLGYRTVYFSDGSVLDVGSVRYRDRFCPPGQSMADRWASKDGMDPVWIRARRNEFFRRLRKEAYRPWWWDPSRQRSARAVGTIDVFDGILSSVRGG